MLKKSFFSLLFLQTFWLSFFFNQAWSKPYPTKNPSYVAQPFFLSEEEEFAAYEQENPTIEIYDPLEKYNRKIYAFNDALDRYFLEHIAIAYRDSLPRKVRKSIRNFLTNLSLPISTFNSILQGKVDNSLATFSNFLINSTIGLAGLFDVAGEKGIRYDQEDFGQTLAYYGVETGAYLVLPILGPSSSRDFAGLIVDKSLNPIEFNILEIGGSENLIDANYLFGIAAASGVDTRESLIEAIRDIRKDSFDPYSTIRSAYLQKRSDNIKK